MHAATSPSLGGADSFTILSSTYTNTVSGTVVTGNLGYTTGPAVAPTVNGATHNADAAYNQAGIAQGQALTQLNSQTCTFTFSPGAVDLASNLDFPTGTYTPGVYCVDGAASIGAAGITLSGSGTYIFRMTGAFTTVPNSVVTLADGASSCDTWWTPGAATTLGANSTLAGTVIDDSGITIGSNVTWNGKALAFGGTVSTDANTLFSTQCTTASLTLSKIVVNDNSGVKTVSDFLLYIGSVLTASGVAMTTLAAGTYIASEPSDPNYTASVWGGDCAANGSVSLSIGDNKTCTITNNDNEPTSSGGSSNRNRRSDSNTASTTPVSTVDARVLGVSIVNETIIPTLPDSGMGPPTDFPVVELTTLAGLLGVLALLFRGHILRVVRRTCAIR